MTVNTNARRAMGALFAATALVGCGAPAWAQDSAKPTATPVASDDGAIVVTARRREESLVNVPIAISAFSGQQLANRGVADITALAEQVPGITLKPSRATNSTLTAFIRGIGQQDPVSGFEQGVGIYLDDVYLNRPQAAVLDVYDVERIEVLRGPQGTLYGRNTVGGAIKYVTKKLDNKLSASARATYGSYNQADGVVSLSAPVTSDGVLRVGASVARLTRDGFGKNLTTGFDNYDKNIWAGRGTVEVHADRFFARLTGDYTHDMSHARGGHRFVASQFSNTPVLANVFDTQGGLNTPKQDVEAWGGSLFLEGKPSDWLTLRSISAYRKDHSTSPIDFDALPAADVDVPGIYRNDQLSQELQVLVASGKFHGLAGFYYLNAHALTQFDVRLFTTYPSPFLLAAYTSANIGTDTAAGFVDGTYDLTDQLSFSAGGRYTWDKRKAAILRQNYTGGGATVFGGAGTPFGSPSTNFDGSKTFTKFTPRASLTFKPDQNTTLYASYSQGFKGGGFDPRGVGVNAPDVNGDKVLSSDEIAAFLGFKPEKLNSYEIGYKADLFNRRVYVALAAFHEDYSDVQIPGSVACTVGGVASFCGVVSNAGKARLRGVEFETRAKLIAGAGGAGLTFTGSLGYIDAKYQQYITNIASKPTDVAAYRKIQNTPAWTGNAALVYAQPLGGGRVEVTGGMSFRSQTYNFEVPNPYLDQPAFQLFDASIVWHAPANRWSLGLFGKNLTDKRYVTSGYIYMAANATTGVLTPRADGTLIPTLGKEGVLTGYYGNPRQIYATATFAF